MEAQRCSVYGLAFGFVPDFTPTPGVKTAPGQAMQAAAGLFLAQKGGCIRVSARFPGLQFAQLWINNGSFRCKRRVSKLPLGLGLFPSQRDAEQR